MVDSVSAFGCRLVDPSLGPDERAAIGLGEELLFPVLARPRKWWNPWGAAAKRQAAVREMERPYPLVSMLRTMQQDAVRFRDVAYALVLIWALTGIAVRLHETTPILIASLGGAAVLAAMLALSARPRRGEAT